MADKNLRELITAEQLRAAVIYKRKTGVFTWRYRWDRSRIWNLRYAGKPAGWRHSEGYRVITIYDVYYRAHRLAWLYVTGEWPSSGEVDHIDTVRDNNA